MMRFHAPLLRSSILAAVTTSTLLAGCALDFPRPADWASPVTFTGASTGENTGESCPALDGIYENQGESAYRYVSNAERALSVRLLQFMPPGRVHRVHLRLAGGSQLEVTVLDQAKAVLRSAVLRRGNNGEGQFSCSDGMLWLPASVTVMKDGTGVGRNRTQLGLTLATDGALTGVQRSTAIGLMAWLVPLALSQDMWFRWMQAPASVQPSGRSVNAFWIVNTRYVP